MKLSSDGTVLATVDNRTIRLSSLPSGAEIETLTHSSPDTITSIELSASGQYIGRTLNDGLRTEVSQVGTGGALLFSDTRPSLGLRLSPNGTIAMATGNFAAFNVATNIYTGTTLLGATPGIGVLWLDDNRLLVHRYNSSSGGQASYSDTVIASPNGAVSPPLPVGQIHPKIVDADRVYLPLQGLDQRIISLSTGQRLWDTPTFNSATYGGVTATHVVFRSGPTVRIEPY